MPYILNNWRDVLHRTRRLRGPPSCIEDGASGRVRPRVGKEGNPRSRGIPVSGGMDASLGARQKDLLFCVRECFYVLPPPMTCCPQGMVHVLLEETVSPLSRQVTQHSLSAGCCGCWGWLGIAYFSDIRRDEIHQPIYTSCQNRSYSAVMAWLALQLLLLHITVVGAEKFLCYTGEHAKL